MAVVVAVVVVTWTGSAEYASGVFMMNIGAAVYSVL